MEDNNNNNKSNCKLVAHTSPLLVWTYCVDGHIPENPISIGFLSDSETPVYLARTWYQGFTHLASISPGHLSCNFYHQGTPLQCSDYQVLNYCKDALGEDKAVEFDQAFTWLPCTQECTAQQLQGHFAMEGGHDPDLQYILCGRAKLSDGTWVVGECGEGIPGCRVGYNGETMMLQEYQVLTLRPEEPKDPNL